MISYDKDFGTVEVEGLGAPVETRATTETKVYTTDTWGQVATLTAKANDTANYCFDKWSDGSIENPRIVEITGNANFEAIFAGRPTITVEVAEACKDYGKVTLEGETELSKKYDLHKEVKIEANSNPMFEFVKWTDGNTDNPRTIKVSETKTFSAEFQLREYVVIDGLKWATQNLAITEYGQKQFYNTIFRNGDYFQWAAYAGYCGNVNDADKGLLIYNSFTSIAFGDAVSNFTFKSNEYCFHNDESDHNPAISPYWNGSSWTKYNDPTKWSNIDSTDDVAKTILGGNWRIPTAYEVKSMKESHYWAWDATDKGFYVFTPDDTHIADKIVTSIPGDLNKWEAVLFFPAAGIGDKDGECHLGVVGVFGLYRTSTPSRDSEDAEGAERLMFKNNSVRIMNDFTSFRDYGYCVRPVSE